MATMPNPNNNFVSEHFLTEAIAGAMEKYPEFLLERQKVRDVIFSIQQKMSELEAYDFHTLKSDVLSLFGYVGESRTAMTSAVTRYFIKLTNTPIRRDLRQAKKYARVLARASIRNQSERDAWDEIVARNEHTLTPDGEPVEYWPDTNE